MTNPVLTLLGNRSDVIPLKAPKAVSVPTAPKSNFKPITLSIVNDTVQDKVIDTVMKNDIPPSLSGGDTTGVGVPGNNILDYISKIESKGKYDALNKTTGAYGKYQFIPSTLRDYANKAGISVNTAKLPEWQDKLALMKVNDIKRELGSYGIPVNSANIYLAWQQGSKGLSDLIHGKGNYRALDLNLPAGVERTPSAFLNYWYKKLG
jgi:hypothetical protein